MVSAAVGGIFSSARKVELGIFLMFVREMRNILSPRDRKENRRMTGVPEAWFCFFEVASTWLLLICKR